MKIKTLKQSRKKWKIKKILKKGEEEKSEVKMQFDVASQNKEEGS